MASRPVAAHRLLAGLLAGLALVLAACGGNGEGDETAAPAGDAAATRTVEHALGTTDVPLRPERVATLSEAVAGHLASVGLLVAAAPDDVPEWLTPYQQGFQPDLDLGSVTLVGTSEEPSLETLAQVAPDMIIIETFSEEFYPELSQIAPTVVVERPSNADWQPAFAQTVALAGRQEEARELESRYEQALAAVPPTAGEVEVSCVRSSADGSFRLDGERAFCGSVAAEAGYAVTAGPPDVMPEEGSGFVELSGERLTAVTGDLIVAQTDSPDVETIDGFTQNPLWETLPAVQSGSVITLPNPIYNNGTYYAATLLLEAIADATG